MSNFNFNELFIYDLANNHQGDFDHAKAIIANVGCVNSEAGTRGALKFQFRQLDSFIHPAHHDSSDNKYVKRFLETSLSMERFRELIPLVRQAGLYTMSTPFDEQSVDVILDMNIDLIKIASCSADDHPLIQRVARTGKPVVVSTAGLRTEEIDWLVSYLESERVNFALMHCVAIYPTPDSQLQLDQVRQLRNRYRGVTVGWSTHERPENTNAVQIAYALGARMFERHVGLQTDQYKLNGYSSTPEQLEAWLQAYRAAKAMIGAPERPPVATEERQTLLELKRGVYVRRAISKGESIQIDDVYFAMPSTPSGMTSGKFKSGVIADKDYAADDALSLTVALDEASEKQLIYQIMLQVRGMLSTAGIAINEDANIEISHHYGLQRFREFGAVLITCVNRDYAKKLVVQLPRQKHPYHYHKKKEETFQLLAGDIEIVKDGFRFLLKPGDILLVQPGEWHKFHTFEGCIFEEVSSTSYSDDSFYEDPTIAIMPREKRKTKVDHWLKYLREMQFG